MLALQIFCYPQAFWALPAKSFTAWKYIVQPQQLKCEMGGLLIHHHPFSSCFDQPSSCCCCQGFCSPCAIAILTPKVSTTARFQSSANHQPQMSMIACFGVLTALCMRHPPTLKVSVPAWGSDRSKAAVLSSWMWAFPQCSDCPLATAVHLHFPIVCTFKERSLCLD